MGVSETFRAIDKNKAKRLMLEKFGLKKNYILYVGRNEPHKNLKAIVLAYRLLPEYLREKYQLVFVGKHDDKYNESLPSMVEFGFSYDRYFEKIFDGKIWPGIRHAVKLLEKQAQDNNMDLTAYVKNLQEKYSRCTQWLLTRGKQKADLS